MEFHLYLWIHLYGFFHYPSRMGRNIIKNPSEEGILMYDVVIVGAGVAGTFIARELARYQLKIIIVDQENDVANATSMANSAIIHAGYDARADHLKGKFNASGNALFDVVCDELDVPFQRCGSLVIGMDAAERETIAELYENGLKNHVPGMRILNQAEVHAIEPNLNDMVQYALWAPTAGIISPWELAIAAAENALENGAGLRLETEVQRIEKGPEFYKVITNRGEYETKYIINCAGLYADRIQNMVGPPSFQIHPRKGHYFILDKEVGNLVNTIVFQCPTDKGKGVLVAPTIHGNILVGPDSEFVDDKDDLATVAERLQYIKETALLSVAKIPYQKVIRSFVGLRAVSDGGDFIIGEAPETKGFINVAGYESPGLSSIPAVAQYVVEIMQKSTGGLRKKKNFNPRRQRVIRFNELSPLEKAAAIKQDPRFGRIICRCETVTEAEIVDAIRRKAGATTVKGVKKRTRAGMGRCQSGFCGPRVLEILARELGKELNEIPYDSSEAFVLTEATKSKR
jgi:glycerol-3-phosphate dehydrogenase